MYQIDNSTAATTIPAPTPAGTPGYFTDGNPATGVAATIMPAEFMNMIMMENMNVLSAAGVTPAKGQYNQLAIAIAKIVSSSTGWDKITGKPTTISGYGITDGITVGQYGLGAVSPTESGSDAIGRPGGFYFFGESANSFSQYASVLNLPYSAGNSAQLAIRQGSPKASAAIRSVNAQGGWTSTAELWTDANFNPGSKADKGATLGAYGITDAYTKSQADSAVNAAISGKADKATTLGGYGITDAYTRTQVNSALDGKLDKSGGSIDGSLYVSTGQSLSSPALSVNSNVSGSAISLIRIKCLDTGVLLSHTNGTSTLSVLTAAGTAATISAGEFLSSGSPCHTAASFMKPVAGQWISLTGGATLPAGGTWAYQVSTFNNTGTLIAGSTAGLAAGGTLLGHATSIGFAWRIQ